MYSTSQKSKHFAIPHPKKYNNVVDVCVGAVSNALTINVNTLEGDEVNLARIIRFSSYRQESNIEVFLYYDRQINASKPSGAHYKAILSAHPYCPNDICMPEFKQNEGKTKDDKKTLDKDHDRVPGVTSIHLELKKKESTKKYKTPKHLDHLQVSSMQTPKLKQEMMICHI